MSPACRPCRIAATLERDGWTGYGRMWHGRCKKRDCDCECGRQGMREPHFGVTRHGFPVHAQAADHLPDHSAYARFNKSLALAITSRVGSMTCAYVFGVLALLSLPAVITQAFRVTWFPGWLVAAGLIALVAWIAQTFLQLVLLSVIMVGQNVQQASSDARAAKTFEDAETMVAQNLAVIDHLNLATPGGLAVVMEELRSTRAEMLSEINGSRDDLKAVIASVMALLRATDPKPPGKPGPLGPAAAGSAGTSRGKRAPGRM